MGHFAEGGHFELAVVAVLAGDDRRAEAGRVQGRIDAQAGEFLVGEVEAVVTFRAYSCRRHFSSTTPST
jgi:hypothetical protein